VSFRIPPENHNSRAYFDMHSIAEILAPANAARLPSLSRALCEARKQVGQGAVRGLAYICRRDSTDDRVLIFVGPRGGWKQLWNFGNGRA
jgi:hypothetical protein